MATMRQNPRNPATKKPVRPGGRQISGGFPEQCLCSHPCAISPPVRFQRLGSSWKLLCESTFWALIVLNFRFARCRKASSPRRRSAESPGDRTCRSVSRIDQPLSDSKRSSLEQRYFPRAIWKDSDPGDPSDTRNPSGGFGVVGNDSAGRSGLHAGEPSLAEED